jgi:hypothetical protein
MHSISSLAKNWLNTAWSIFSRQTCNLVIDRNILSVIEIGKPVFQKCEGGSPEPMADIFRHNQMDLCGLASLALHVIRMLEDPEHSGCAADELFGISRMLQRRGDDLWPAASTSGRLRSRAWATLSSRRIGTNRFATPLFRFLTRKSSTTKKALATKEGLHVGFSAAANVCACIKLIHNGILGSNPFVVTVLCDSGLKY